MKNNLLIFSFLILIGIFCGAMMMTFSLTLFSIEKMAEQKNLVAALWLGFCVLGPIILLELRKLTTKIAAHLPLTDATRAQFLKFHPATYVIFLGYGLVLAGVKANVAFTLLMLLLFITVQIILLWCVADQPQKTRWLHSLDAIPLLFFFSGFAALVYQVVWQRVLFATFGTNIESVTVIVSVFMFGLGVGALAGGQVQKHFPHRLLEYFIGAEIAIGLFGLISIPLIQTVGWWAPHDSLLSLIAVTYALLALPTMLMGSTLPLLVGYLQRHYRNLGTIVGKLYAYNTLGSALASLLTVMLLFTMMGRQSTLIVAAACNMLTAAAVWYFYKQQSGQPLADAVETNAVHGSLPYRSALLLSALIGYVSLSLEILWFRVLGFMTSNLPQVFGVMLAIFLAGIAYGSLKAKRWSESGRDAQAFVHSSLIWLAAIAYLSVPVAGMLSAGVGKFAGIIAGYIAIGLLAYFSGGLFPLLCQMGVSHSQGKQAGVAVSWIYFLNIVGATLGSLITGFILFDAFALPWNVIIISALIVGLLMFLPRAPSFSRYALAAAAIMGMIGLQPFFYKDIIGKLQGVPEMIASPKYVNETRHGIITVFEDKDGDMIFGNGAYDGRFNIDPARDSNGITRVYMLAALHPKPERVLEMGMSAASATKVITMYRPLQQLRTVEINPGYADVIAHYPEIDSALHHPKMKLTIDDGRRWLLNHPDERFDVITMNTIYYWRNNATHLLSREFLEICKRHLNPGGIIYYNTTGARDSAYTVAHLFKHVVRVHNFVAASDSPFNLTPAQKKKNLLAFIGDNGKPVFAHPNEALLETLANAPLQDIREEILAENNLWLITDDNMASEYKINYAFLPPGFYQ